MYPWYQEALTIPKYLFWNLCNIFIFELGAMPHNWMSYKIDLGIALYNNNLFSSNSCDLLPNSQYILPN